MIGLIILLMVIFIAPLVFHKVEENLEIFLFIIALLSVIISNTLNLDLVGHILSNKFIYLITAAVLLGGVLFNYFRVSIGRFFEKLTKKVNVKIIVFMLIVVLGLLSSLITAIIAALVLVELIHFLPISRKNKIKINIIACYSIGLGAALTPIGEPLSTIVVSKLNADFLYIFNLLGVYIIPAIIFLGLLGAYLAKPEENLQSEEMKEETNKDIVIRSIKVFVFIIALELLGTGFKPLIDEYILNLNGRILYFVNILSAVLDNATMASAEISLKMTQEQIKAILMGLLISGGMMIPGNIPNIISSSKMKITSKEWMKFALPLGIILLGVYYVILFI